MLLVVIFVCVLLIGCNAFYSIDENEGQCIKSNGNIKK